MQNIQDNELLIKGKDCFKRGEYKNSITFLSELTEKNDTTKAILVEAFFLIANIFHIRGEIGKAIKAFNKVLALDPNHTDASISLSVLYNDIGHYEDAKKVFEKASERVKQAPIVGCVEDQHVNIKFANKHYEIAEMYMTYNRFDEALFEYNKVIGLNPSMLEARIKVAKVYAKKNFMSKAFEELRNLKNEYPSYIPARVSLGVLYYGSGKVLEAQSEWEKVLVKEPKNSEARMYINLSRTATETTI